MKYVHSYQLPALDLILFLSYFIYIYTVLYSITYSILWHLCHYQSSDWLVAWISGNALDSINEVTLRHAQLVLGWVTV